MVIPGLGPVSQGALALLIPIIAIIGAFASGMFAVYHRMRRQREMLQLYHAERMAAIEKGIELPPLPPELFHDSYRGHSGRRCRDRYHYRYRGVVLSLVGVAVTVALWQTGGNKSFWWGLVIVAWGVGLLVIGFLERDAPSGPPQAGGPGNSTDPGRG
ncbi:MAG: DUF6249 domain-containing protein [Steroidobacteraceae bacterium]